MSGRKLNSWLILQIVMNIENSIEKYSVPQRLLKCLTTAAKPAFRTAFWLLKVMIPISLAMTLLQYFGILGWIGHFLKPVFQYLGLPGEAAMAYLSGLFVTVYACISTMGVLTLTAKQITIIGIMCLISHNIFVEKMVQKKTGSSTWRIALLRIITAFIAGYIFNLLIPENNIPIITGGQKLAQASNLSQVLITWLSDSLYLTIKVLIIILLLMYLQQILQEFGVNKWLSRLFAPVMEMMGLPRETAFLWIVANTLGLTYGSAVLIQQTEEGLISQRSADLLNHHIAISHSLLEDTLLLFAVGALGFWIFLPRILMAVVVVWLRRLELHLRHL
jgi:hypothetical protein